MVSSDPCYPFTVKPVQADKSTGKGGTREPVPYVGKTGTVREIIRTILDAWIKRGAYHNRAVGRAHANMLIRIDAKKGQGYLPYQ